MGLWFCSRSYRNSDSALDLPSLITRYLLLPLLAAFALPTAANAESIWLVLASGRNNGQSSSSEMVKIEVMTDISYWPME